MTETVSRCDKIAEMLTYFPRSLRTRAPPHNPSSLRCLPPRQRLIRRLRAFRYIEKRLKELDAERKELAAYQKLDKRRKALEYTYYHKEQCKARTELDKMEAKGAEESERAKLQCELEVAPRGPPTPHPPRTTLPRLLSTVDIPDQDLDGCGGC